MRMLVTGATGLVGNHVVRAAEQAGHSVRALVRPSSDVSILQDTGAELVHGDVTQPDSLHSAARGCDAVVHTAAIIGEWGPWEEFFRVGVQGTRNVLEAAVVAGATRFVQLSSIAVYGSRIHGRLLVESDPYDERPEPWNPYVREKVQSERLAFEYHERGAIAIAAVRPSVILGAGDRTALPRTIAILNGPTAGIVGKGRNRVACVSARDVADVCLRAATLPVAAGRAYNVSSDETYSQDELMRLIADAVNIRPARLHVPFKAVWATATVMERVYALARAKNPPPISRFNLLIIASDIRVDTSLAHDELGWRELQPLPEAIAEDAAWLRRTDGSGPEARA